MCLRSDFDSFIKAWSFIYGEYIDNSLISLFWVCFCSSYTPNAVMWGTRISPSSQTIAPYRPVGFSSRPPLLPTLWKMQVQSVEKYILMSVFTGLLLTWRDNVWLCVHLISCVVFLLDVIVSSRPLSCLYTGYSPQHDTEKEWLECPPLAPSLPVWENLYIAFTLRGHLQKNKRSLKTINPLSVDKWNIWKAW